MKTRKALLVAVTALSLVLPMWAHGDDTDIYFNPKVPPAGLPMVMFSLDYRSNLTSTASASTVGGYFCNAGFGAMVNQLSTIGGGGTLLTNADGSYDCSSNGTKNLKLVLLDTIILSLYDVLSSVSDVKVGLMFSHNSTNPTIGYQGESPPSKADSDGGVILQGFQPLDSTALANFTNKLIALKKLKPQSNSPDHPYQGSQLFFEFFRYLTGQHVYEGHSGWADFEGSGGVSVDNKTDMRCTSSDSILKLACWDASIETPNPLSSTNPASTPPQYLSPFADAAACAKIFTINFLFQVSNDSSSESGMFTTSKANGGLGIKAPSSSGNYFPTMVQFLNQTDLADGTLGTAPALTGMQNVTSYFIVDPTKINQTTTSYAKAGGTDVPLALSSDPATLVQTLRDLLHQVLSVSTTFVSASVPTNVFNRSQVVDNVYFALFQPDPKFLPHWDGNLKKLRTQTNPDGSVTLVDALGNPAISATDGRINLDALTYWTDPTGTLLDVGDTNGDGMIDNYDGTGAPANPSGMSTDRDGRWVARGGAVQKLPGFSNNSSTTTGGSGPGDTNPAGNTTAAGPRKLFYLKNGALAPLEATVALAGDSSMQSALGAPGDSTTTLALLRYARGQNYIATNATNTSQYRLWPLGDPLHSKPFAVNYGAFSENGVSHTTSNPAIFIAMGANDGMLHFFRNTTTGSTTMDQGQEVWAFMPPEGLAVQKQLYQNAPATSAQVPHPYSVDGESTVLVVDVNQNGTIEPSQGDKVWLFFALRRGGRAYYALDITDPLNPKFLWRITPTSITNASGTTATNAYAELADAFSPPKITVVPDGIYADGSIRQLFALVIGGGYYGGVDAQGDPIGDRGPNPSPGYSGNPIGKDIDALGTNDPIGNAVFLVQVDNGNLIWKATGGSAAPTAHVFQHPAFVDSVPSSIALIDTNADNATDRLLFGDTGGNVWRADLPNVLDGAGKIDRTQWKLTKLATVGRHYLNDKADDRRFFDSPDMVQTSDVNGRYDAVIIGSGDREDPLDKGGQTVNWFYMIADRNVGIGAGVDSTRTQDDFTDITGQCLAGSPCTIGVNGWKLQLNHTPSSEKSFTDPSTINGTIFFTTYVPPGSDPNSCTLAEGSSLFYAIRLSDGEPAYNFDVSNGGLQSDEGGTTATDRSKDTGSPGLSTNVVSLGFNTVGSGCNMNLLSGTMAFNAKVCSRYRTFWERRER